MENFKNMTPDPTIRRLPDMILFFRELHECIWKMQTTQ